MDWLLFAIKFKIEPMSFSVEPDQITNKPQKRNNKDKQNTSANRNRKILLSYILIQYLVSS